MPDIMAGMARPEPTIGKILLSQDDIRERRGARRHPVRVEETGLGADGGNRAHAVEEVGQHQGEVQQSALGASDLTI